MGTYDMKANAETGEDALKPEYRGGPLALESTMQEYLKNKQTLDALKTTKRKVKLFESTDILDEKNLLQDPE
jgi:hypothetical protein